MSSVFSVEVSVSSNYSYFLIYPLKLGCVQENIFSKDFYFHVPVQNSIIVKKPP